MLRRSLVSPRQKPLTQSRQNTNSKTQKCIYCRSDHIYLKWSKQYVCTKYKLTDDTLINQFLTASRFLQDAVFSRTANLNSVKEVTVADVFYHNKCHKEYCSKYDDEIKKVDQSGSAKSTEKRDLFLEAMKDSLCLRFVTISCHWVSIRVYVIEMLRAFLQSSMAN